MRIKLVFLLLIIAHVNLIFTQTAFEDFRDLEQRVKYIQPDSLRIYSQSLDTSSSIGKAMKYWSLGRSEHWRSNYPEAYVSLKKSAVHLKKLNKPQLLAELYLDLASSLSVVDQNGQALSYLLEANDILETIGDTESKARAAISLGEMYRKISDYDMAYQVLHRTRNIAKKHSYNYARCLNRLAAVHSETSRHDSSLYYSFHALEIAKNLNEPNLIATSENEIGFIYRNRSQFKEALPHFERADSLWRSVGMLRYAINSMHHISVIYGSLFEIEKSLKVTYEAYNLVKDKNWYLIEASLLEDLISLHDHMNRIDSVNYYKIKRLEAIINWKDQQYRVNTKMVTVMYTQENNEQTIREQKILLENEVLEKASIQQERTNLLIIVLLIILILLIIFIYAYQQRKLKIKLAQENEKKELKNRQLSEAITANEALVQEISHRVKNNLAVLSGLLSMQAARSNNEKVIKELNDSVLRIESIATIHKKLYDKRTDAKVNLKEALTELSFNVLSAMGKNPQDCLIVNIDECEIEIAKAVTFCLIINEVITNSCKYGEVNSDNKLTIQVTNSKDTIICEVADKGPGFEIDNIDNNTKSLGVYLIKLLAKQLKATISWSKTKENFIFRIQLIKNE